MLSKLQAKIAPGLAQDSKAKAPQEDCTSALEKKSRSCNSFQKNLSPANLADILQDNVEILNGSPIRAFVDHGRRAPNSSLTIICCYLNPFNWS